MLPSMRAIRIKKLKFLSKGDPWRTFSERVRHFPCGRFFVDSAKEHRAKEDLELALCANRFSFAIGVKKERGYWWHGKKE